MTPARQAAGRNHATAPCCAVRARNLLRDVHRLLAHVIRCLRSSPIVKFGSLLSIAGDDAKSAYPGLDCSATAVLLLDRALTIVYANAAAENLFELSKKQIAGRRPREIFIDSANLLDAVDKAVRAGASYTEQELELTVPGKPRLHLTCTVSPIEVRGATLLLEFRHIDQQLQIAREERLQDQQQANRDLIRNLAHEIKNPLGGMRGAAQLLERELDRPHLIEYTQVIMKEADRLQSLVNRLLTPHRAASYRRTNVHETLERVEGVVQAEFPQVAFVPDYDVSLPEFDADQEQIIQALLNIVRNAAQALAGTTVSPILLTTRVARSVTLAKKRHRLALVLSVERQRPWRARRSARQIFFPLVSGREGGSGLGSRSRKPSSPAPRHDRLRKRAGTNLFTILLPLKSAAGA